MLAPSSEQSLFGGLFVCLLCFVLFLPVQWQHSLAVANKVALRQAHIRVNVGAGALISTVIALRLGNLFPEEGGPLFMETRSKPNLGLSYFLSALPSAEEIALSSFMVRTQFEGFAFFFFFFG